MKAERFENGPMMYLIKDIPSDMGESTSMDLLIQSDGDAIISLRDKETGQRMEIEICTYQGGTHTPELALRFKQMAEFLYHSQHPEDKITGQGFHLP